MTATVGAGQIHGCYSICYALSNWGLPDQLTIVTGDNAFVWTMLCLDDDLFGQSFVWTMLCLDNVLLGQCFVWTMFCLDHALFG